MGKHGRGDGYPHEFRLPGGRVPPAGGYVLPGTIRAAGDADDNRPAIAIHTRIRVEGFILPGLLLLEKGNFIFLHNRKFTDFRLLVS